MNLGEFRKTTAALPDNTPLLVGFQDADGDKFVVDGHTVVALPRDEIEKKYGWSAFGALPGEPVTLFTFDPQLPRPHRRRAVKKDAVA